jgi:hypothetical protein
MLQKIKSLKSLNILTLLLSADIFFIILHLFHKIPLLHELIPLFEEEAFSISHDLGLAEAFQYVQELWIALLFLWLVIHFRKKAYWGWSALFVYFLADDMLGVHEWLGDHLGPLMENLVAGTPLAGSKMDSLGELVPLAGLGLVFFVILFLTYKRSDLDTRNVFRILTWMTIALLFFGIMLDFADTFLPSEMLKSVARLIEDGGEMFVMSIICWYTLTLTDRVPSQT